MSAQANQSNRSKAAAAVQSGDRLHRGKYPPEAFIVPGQDQNGVSVRLWCRVVPLLDRAIDVLVGTRKFPFQTKGDLMRWCIKSGVDKLNDMEPVTGSVLIQVDAMMKVLVAEQHYHSYITLFDTMGKTVGMHVQAQAIGEARRLVGEMIGYVAKMEDGYWRRRYMEEIKAKFGYLIDAKMVAGVGLGSHEDHGPDAATDEDDLEGD